jgi:hypothetical protein
MQGPFIFFPFAFPVVFAGMWLLVTVILSAAAGLPALARRFPDRDEPAGVTLHWQSGMMGANVRLNRVLTLSACPSGLRVAIWKPFALFAKPFLVPWNEIHMEERKVLFGTLTKLTFGEPAAGHLTLYPKTWARLTEGRAVRTASRIVS